MRSLSTAAACASSTRVLTPSAAIELAATTTWPRAPSGDDVAHAVGEVELSLRVVRIDPVERLPHGCCREDVEGAVHLGERQLLGRGVLRLDDRRKPSRGIAHDASVRPRLVEHERQHRHVGACRAMSVDELLQELLGDERRVPGEHENVSVVAAEGRACRRDGVAGSSGLRLHRDRGRTAVAERVRRLRRRDDDERGWAQRLHRPQHPVHHPAAEQRMEMLGRRRAHARALAGGHDDRGEAAGVVHREGWGARIRTWGRGTKTRCLTTWLRPTKLETILPSASTGLAGRGRAGRRRQRRRSRRARARWRG